MKTYRRHNCTAQHRTARTFMKCAVRNAVWVMGSGEFALIAWCGLPSISLWASAVEAEEERELLDGTGCGGRCTRRHEVVRVDLEGVQGNG